MPFIKGIDHFGKAHWLQESLNWGEAISAKNFTPHTANQQLKEIRLRNRYLDPIDQIAPELQETRNGRA